MTRLRSMGRAATGWFGLLVLCAVVLTVADTLLLGIGTGYLTSGFNTPRIDWLSLILFFLPASLLLDLWLVLGIWALSIPVLRRLSGSPLQVVVMLVILSLVPPLVITAIDYNAHTIVGNLVTHVLAQPLARAGASDLALETFIELPYVMVLLLLILIGVQILAVAARRIERRFDVSLRRFRPPPARSLLLAFAVLALVCSVPITVAALRGSDLLHGFDRKLSGHAAKVLLDRITDYDRDGFGALSRPADPDPVSARIYPYAPDLPGNGIDENGLAGDHPLDVPAPPSQALPEPVASSRPHLLLVYLESFREDLLGARSASGRSIAPFLDRLAAEGAASSHAYAHSPWTLDSRSQLFSGRMVSRPGEPTLIDDFRERGYYVAHISGQDESYGDSESMLGTGRADFFYDARRDLDRRTSRSTAPVSLQVSWKTVLERVVGFLDEWPGGEPLFLYVNVVDTHFPYWHSEIDDLLGVPPLHRGDIRIGNAEHVRAAYENTAANVDLAVSRIVEAFRERVGDEPYAILVTADHAQAIYDRGMLGHGRTLEAEMTRVPFIVWGMGGEWPEPIGPTDVRGLLRRHLGVESADTTARFVPKEGRRLLQYAPDLSEPTVIALQGAEDRIEYDFRSAQLRRVAPDGTRAELPPDRRDVLERELVWAWESAQLEDLEAHAAAGSASD